MITHSRFYQTTIIFVCLSLFLSPLLMPLSVQASRSAKNPDVLDSLAVDESSAPENQSEFEQLMQGAAFTQHTPRQPTVLATPIVVSKKQSTYHPAGALDQTMIITFTVTNQLLPVHIPQIPENSSITDTMDIMSTFDYANDPNTIRNVLLVNELTTNATYITSFPLPDSQPPIHAWNLGDIPPLGTVTATLQVEIPTSITAATSLDEGAVVWGTLQGREVTAQTLPATLLPDSFGDWLGQTIDADILDEYMLAKAAELGQDPIQIFTYVRSLGYEAYPGSLRGTRGTLWSEAGNSLDQASLLIAMLRASGIPARYRHGVLDPTTTQQLILTMFPEPTRVMGHIPEGVMISDPVNDQKLVVDTEDHWWVEAYLSGQGWVDLDPTFPEATIGQRFVTSDNIDTNGTDRIQEIPDAYRHKVTMRLKTENYNILNAGPGHLAYTYPLSHTFNTVELVGNPVTVGHLVDSSVQGGMVFGSVQHTYTPYFLVGDETFLDSSYQDFFSNFASPVSTVINSGAWLILETHDPDGGQTVHERNLADLFGFEARQFSGTIYPALGEGSAPLIDETTYHQVMINPGEVPLDALKTHIRDIVQVNQDLTAASEQLRQATGEAERLIAEQQVTAVYRDWTVKTLHALNVMHYSQSDYAMNALAPGMLVKSYAVTPRLIIASQELQADGSIQTTLDLLKDDIFAYAFPGQNQEMPFSFQGMRGLMESRIEGMSVTAITGQPAVTTALVFDEVHSQDDIDVVVLTSTDFDRLATLDISDEAKGRIHAALVEGKIVTVPAQMVEVNGEQAIGWWEKDITTGETSGVMENGLHTAAGEYAFLANFGANIAAFEGGFSSSFFITILDFVSNVLEDANKREPLDIKDILKDLWLDLLLDVSAVIVSEKANIKDGRLQGIVDAYVSRIKAEINSCRDGKCGEILQPMLVDFYEELLLAFLERIGLDIGTALSVGRITGNLAALFLLEYSTKVDPPLPPSLINIPTTSPAENEIRTSLTVPASLSGATQSGTINASIFQINSTGGNASLYARAVSGMGVGGQSDAYGINNYVASAAIQAQNVNLMMGSTNSGSLQIGNETVPVQNGFAIADYTGNISVVEATTETDTITLPLSQGDFFALELTAASSTIEPTASAQFEVDILANYADTYTMTVAAPVGWAVAMDNAGGVTAVPPAGAAEGDYTLLIVAQSETYPDLFASAVHMVIVAPYEGVTLVVTPDPLITTPWGSADLNTVPGGTNNGQMQVPGAAYTINITNTSNLPHTFNIATAGLPNGWPILSNNEGAASTTLSLPAGGVGQIGLYISPPESALPAAGSSYPFSVSAVADDNGSLTAVANNIFTVPSLPFGQLKIDSPEIISSPGYSTTFHVAVSNVGNAAGSFAVTTSLPDDEWTAVYNSPLLLSAGERITQAVTVDTPTGSPGQNYPVILQMPAGVYTQTKVVNLRMVGPNGLCGYMAETAVSELGDPVLTSAVTGVRQTMIDLELNLSSDTQREQLIAALTALVAQLEPYPSAPGDEFLQIRDALQTHTTEADILTDLNNLCTTLTDLTHILSVYQLHGVGLRYSPGIEAALPGQAKTITLTLTNDGSETTTYAAAFTSDLFAPFTQTETLNPGESLLVPLSLSTATLGFYEIEARVTGVGDEPALDLIQQQATARFNVIDSFVEILAVELNPAFVETGTSTTDLSLTIANKAKIFMPATAQVQIQASAGDVIWTQETPIDINPGSSRSLNVGTIDTSGWSEDVYTTTVSLLDEQNNLIPDGIGYSYLSVGQGLEITQAVTPALVAPGTITVTTAITTQIRQSILPPLAQPQKSERNQFAAGNSESPLDTPVYFSNENARMTVGNVVELEETEVFTETDAFTPIDLLPTEKHSATIPTTLVTISVNESGIIRYEEDNTTLFYNGVSSTVTSWNLGPYAWASSGSAAWSDSAGDTVSLTFNGSWVNVGLLTRSAGGYAEVYIDGSSQGIVDTYSRTDNTISRAYPVISGTHTISVTVAGSHNPLSSSDIIRFDYFDVWDGTEMPSGTIEAEGADVARSSDWNINANANASGGSYIRSRYTTSNVNVWFPFTGESVTFQATTDSSKAKIFIDGAYQATFNPYTVGEINPRTISFGNLAPGPHILQVQSYRWYAAADAITVPATGPFYEPPTATLQRYEEDDPALRFNGVPLEVTADSWSLTNYSWGSSAYAAASATTNDTVSLTFNGSWVNIGFITRSSGGNAEILIDGISQGIVDTYSATDDVIEQQYNMSPGNHTLDIVVLGTSNPSASNVGVRIDYIDVWDGTELLPDLYQEDDAGVHLSSGWTTSSSSQALGSNFVEDGSNAWFLFTGDRVAFVGLTDQYTNQVEVFIDGVSQGVVDLTYAFSFSPVPVLFDNLGDGAHVIRIKNLSRARIDAFDTSTTPVAAVPMVEWFDMPDTGEIITTITTGDINEDGSVEIVAAYDYGDLIVYRGDGQITGSGTPAIWTQPLNGRGDSPALANLDGLPGSEIIIADEGGLSAYHADGSLYWYTDTVRTANGGAAIANIDDDPEPEIVTSGVNCPCVFEADGSLAWRYTLTNPLPPVLADLTGDGRLDILAVKANTMYLIDYAAVPPAIVWTQTFTTTIEGRGTPGIADIDGLQPGGDDGPEIAVVADGFVHLVDDNGDILWSQATAPGDPGGVSIADTDGDGEVEIVATSKVNDGRIYVLNADGSLLWDMPVIDTSSANSGSVIDLDGDGQWEVVWNGWEQGLTIFRGDTGEIVFNEPAINSGTIMDYPTLADVDNDGHVEIIAGDNEGIYIIGNDSQWASSRPIWNQYSYHITNINDDLTTPLSELDSWLVHNTYRTQTSRQQAAPNYQIELTHTVAASGVSVLPGTFSSPPVVQGTDYQWTYDQQIANPTHVTSFSSQLADMKPGEVRQISEGTTVFYMLSSGQNSLRLPPLYVQAQRLASLTPTMQSVSPGGSVMLVLHLTNPGDSSDTYTLEPFGVPADWVTFPSIIDIDAGVAVSVPVTLTVPTTAVLAAYDFGLAVTNSSGGQDQASAVFNVEYLLALSLTPATVTAVSGQQISATLAITNQENLTRTYILDTVGLGLNFVSLPPETTVAANSMITLPVTLTASDLRGVYPFSLEARAETGTVHKARGALTILNDRQVVAALAPSEKQGGPGTLVAFGLTITNTGELADNYTISLGLPDDWHYRISANGDEINAIDLTPFIYNAGEYLLEIIPAVTAVPGAYPFSVTSQSQSVSSVRSVVTGTVNVTAYGVQVMMTPEVVTLSPQSGGSLQVQVTNTGDVADTYALNVEGFLAQGATFSPAIVTLAPGQSQSVQLAVDALPFVLPLEHEVIVTAQSTTQSYIQDLATAVVQFSSYENASFLWQPDYEVVTDTLSATLMMVITNTGNLGTIYQLTLDAPGISATAETNAIFIPAHMTARIPVEVHTNSLGIFQIAASAASGLNTTVVGGSATVVFSSTAAVGYDVYLPVIIKH